MKNDYIENNNDNHPEKKYDKNNKTSNIKKGKRK